MICWISIDALKASVLVYGGVNLLLLMIFIFITYRMYRSLDPKKKESKLHKLIFSGREWEPIIKAQSITQQLEELISKS